MGIEKKQTGLLGPLDPIMCKRKQKSKFTLIALFLILGIGMLYFGIDILLDAEDSIRRGFILIHYNNIFIKYGFSFMCFFAGLGCIFLPILAVKNVLPVGAEYYEGNKLAKAKSNFIVISVCLPAIIFFVSTVYYSDLKLERPFLVYGFAAVVIYTYFASILRLTIFRHKYENDKST
jgi:uncharacterized membrane protein YidH (DUF202 family)